MEPVIRTYRAEDLAALKALTVDAFEPVSMDRNMEALLGAIGSHDWRWRKARQVEEDCLRDPEGVFVASIGEHVIGYITTWMDREACVGHIPNLAVDQSQRQRGLGRRLIEHALDHFRQNGMQAARIETLEQNPIGQKLYPSLGFQEIARQIHYARRL